MSIQSMAEAAGTRRTPQAEPIPGREADMGQNHAGGFSFVLDDWARLDRFLVLGVEAGTYYVGERTLTKENAAVVTRCLAVDGARVVRRIVEVSEAGRAPKTEPCIFALAMAMKLGDAPTRAAAQAALPRVCRTGTHLFGLAEAVQAFGGWGRGTKRAFASWYTAPSEEDLVYQAIKYQARNGWSHRDLLRLAKPKGYAPETVRGSVFHWITRGWPEVGDAPHPDAVLARVWAFERAKQSASPAETVRLIEEYRLPRECVKTEHLQERVVWDALLRSGSGMPLTALVRNLATMTRVGLLDSMGEATRYVVDRLADGDYIRRSRLHPLALLVALRTYAQGRSERGTNTWSPVAQVVDALDRAFPLSFGNVTRTNRRWCLALDVSGSMGMGTIAGLPGITPRVASAALAMITAAVEPSHEILAFATQLARLAISPRQRLDDIIRAVSGLPFGGTDCALPMVYAAQARVPFDAFVILTDSETWHGSIHPAQALRMYRESMGIPARLIVVGMTATEVTVADPADGGSLDVVGFDTSTPQVMADFVGAG